MTNRLKILTVGSSSNLLYYSWKLQSSKKFDIHVVNDELDVNKDITINDNSTNSQIKFKPEIVVNSIQELTKGNQYEIIFVSCKSLQEISTVSATLTPFLSKNSIILIESTGFINLEPFLLNSLPSSLQLSFFSILSTIDLRKKSSNNYINLDVTREIYLGESSTSTSKYSNNNQQNLNALSKLLQYNNTDGLKIIIKPSHLEFLIEEWKLAIPKICFDPLLILFEETSPENLNNQILAKPLLSGLITELITVAKTMGCKLPIGYDNESNFLNNWIKEYKDRPIKDGFLGSPQLFYNFYHKLSLNVDLLLLQPILLADDYGIKTPYLEFLYATICQFDKLNQGSIFFKRTSDDDDLKLQLNDKSLKLIQSSEQTDQLNEILKKRDAELAQIKQELSNQNDQLNDVAQLRLNIDGLNQSLNLKSKQLSTSETTIQSLQSQIQALQSQIHQVQTQQAPTQQIQAPRSTSLKPSNSNSSIKLANGHIQQPELPSNDYTNSGTPDLRDLTDMAVYSSQFDSPANKKAQTPEEQPQQQLNGQPADPLGRVNSSNDLAAKELELQRREQLLKNKELEYNKRMTMLNSRPPPQQLPQFQQGSQQQVPQQQLQAPQQIPLQQQNLQGRFNSIQGPPPPHQHQQLQPGLQINGHNGLQQNLQGLQLQAPIQPRRISTMPTLDNDPNFMMNPQFKKTSRKNRKSSFPALGSASNLGQENVFNDFSVNGGNQRGKRLGGPQPQFPQGGSPLLNGPMNQNFNNSSLGINHQHNSSFQRGLSGIGGGSNGAGFNPHLVNQKLSKPPNNFGNGNNSSHSSFNTTPNNNSNGSNNELPLPTGQSTQLNSASSSSNINNTEEEENADSSVIHSPNPEIEAKPLGWTPGLDDAKPLGSIAGEGEGEVAKETKKKKFSLFKKKK